jgi:hypothetical protein
MWIAVLSEHYTAPHLNVNILRAFPFGNAFGSFCVSNQKKTRTTRIVYKKQGFTRKEFNQYSCCEITYTARGHNLNFYVVFY